MPDNLRITTPINTDQAGRLKSHKAAAAVPNIDPSKVFSKSDSAGDAGHQTDILDSNSVFGGFIASLSKTPLLSDSLGKLISAALAGLNSEIDAGSPVDANLSALANAAVMTKEEMLSNILFQQANITAFSADIFKLLKKLSGNASPEEFSAYLGRFIKAYDGYAASNTTLTGIAKQLKNILDYIPKSYREPIEQSIANLKLPVDAGGDGYGLSRYPNDDDLGFNLTLLKDKVLPLLARYIAAFNDFGEIRDKISLLIHNISILNVGSRSLVEESFGELMEYCRYEMHLSPAETSEMKKLFSELFYNPPLNTANKLIDALAGAMTLNPAGGLYGTGQAMLMEAINTLLLDYSVYMPFFHLFLPVSYRNAFMFADIWIEKRPSRQSGSQSGKTIYISFDIQNFGLFEGEIFLKSKDIECNLFLPRVFGRKLAEVEQNIRNIFIHNGFTAKINCFIDRADIYSKIKQRVTEERDGINVTI